MNQIENHCAEELPSEQARPRQLRTITLVEQRDDDGQISWALIEGSDTLFGLNEPNLLHAVSQQVFGMKSRHAKPIASISRHSFEVGLGTGRHAGVQEERGRAARARVEAEEEAIRQREDIRMAKKRAVKKQAAAVPPKPAKRKYTRRAR